MDGWIVDFWHCFAALFSIVVVDRSVVLLFHRQSLIKYWHSSASMCVVCINVISFVCRSAVMFLPSGSLCYSVVKVRFCRVFMRTLFGTCSTTYSY